jgi:hypothetical protein
MIGTGESEGENRALAAAERAIANPLLAGASMQGAKGVIISIIGGEDLKLLEVDEAANHIRELVHTDANIIWGSAFNPDLEGKIRVSVVATGLDLSEPKIAPTIADVAERGLGPAGAPEDTGSHRRRGLVSTDEALGEQSVAGTTLFERMANLARARTPAKPDDEFEDGSSQSIPRFLGSHNNQ